MSLMDKNNDFLVTCKQLYEQQRIGEVVIVDKPFELAPAYTRNQLAASEYAAALTNKPGRYAHSRQSTRATVPVLYALLHQQLAQSKYPDAERTLHQLKQLAINHPNKHVLTFNLSKVCSLQGKLQQATFHCESLLKQSGQGLDYYTYEFLILLISQGRYDQAYAIASRHAEVPKDKHKIQGIYIYLLDKMYERQDVKMFRKLQKVFNGKTVCLRNYYNLAQLLRYRHPEKSLEMFQKIVAHVTGNQKWKKLEVMARINIVNIYEMHYLPHYPDHIVTTEAKAILNECEEHYSVVKDCVEDSEEIDKKLHIIQQSIIAVEEQLKNQSKLNESKSSDKKSNFLRMTTEVFASGNIKKEQQNEAIFEYNTGNYFQEKRIENQKRLKFLINKQKELANFFNQLKIQKKGSKLNIKVREKSVATLKKQKSAVNFNKNENEIAEALFEEKRKKFELIYNEKQLNELINDFVDEWLVPANKEPRKISNIQAIKKFACNLQLQIQSPRDIVPLTESKSSLRLAINSNQKKSSHGFRVKNNTSRQDSEKKIFQSFKNNNDSISHQIISNLKAVNNQKVKQSRPTTLKPKVFADYVKEVEQLQLEGKYEEAHDRYTKMYKKYKSQSQKEVLLLKIAQNYQSMDCYEEAQKTYIKCSKFNSAEAFFKLGSLQLKLNQIQEGIENLQKANCIDRHNIKIQTKMVYAYSLMEDTTQRALALARSILQRDPECIQALIMTSKILQKKGKLKEALDIALAICSTCKSAPTYHYIGLLYLNDSNVSLAYRYFQLALETQPGHVPSLIELATILSEARPKQSIEILKKALVLDPKSQMAFARLGKIYETIECDYDSALEVYKKGLQCSPSYENHLKIGDCLVKLGSVPEAYLHYKEALALKKTPQIYERIGDINQMQHQQKKSIEAYTQALAALPQDNSSFNLKKKYLTKLGKLSLSLQEYETAFNYLSQVADMEENPETLKLLAQASFGKNDFNEALKYYEMTASMQEEQNLELMENMAMCYDKLEDYLTSKQIYQKILAVDPKNIRCLNNLANILLIMGKTNQAFYWFEFMLQQVPTNIDKRLRVADIYATIGDWSKVEQHLTICYKMKENDVRVIERMVNLYKEKRDMKQLNKFEKRLALLKNHSK